MKALDSFAEREARRLIGLTVVDEQGEKIGCLSGIWVDPTTHHVQFMGLKSSWLFRSTHLIPSRSVEVETGHGVVRVQFPAEFLKEAPRYNPKTELSDLEKQGINAYYGHVVPLRRTSAIEDLRPEQALPPEAVTAARTATQDRATIETSRTGFLQSGRFRNRCDARSERCRRTGADNQRSEAARKGI